MARERPFPISEEPSQMPVSGPCEARFAAVKAEFERAPFGDQYAAVCVCLDGRPVVDLTREPGGSNHEAARPQRALTTVFSCTKGAVALCLHRLASAGEIDLDAEIRRYWPAFAAEDKADITVRMVLNHTAGLPGVSEPMRDGELADWDAAVNRIGREAPLWRPGRYHGYHPITFGSITGEVVRRATGATVGQCFAEWFARPLSLDFWIGLPSEHSHRVRPVTPAAGPAFGDAFADALRVGALVQVRTWNSVGNLLEPKFLNSSKAWAAEIPGVNGIANARGIAGLYSVVSNRERAVEFGFDPVSYARITTTEVAGPRDLVTLSPFRFSSGFEQGVAADPGALTLPSTAFGFTGLGGSVGFADPELDLAFGFVTNRHAETATAFARAQQLVDATYRAVGDHAGDRELWASARKPGLE